MATVSRIRVYPLKSLDGVDVSAVPICGSGRLEFDREYAMFDRDGKYVNGRQNQLVHRLTATFDMEAGTVELSSRDQDETVEYRLDDSAGHTELEEWLSEFFGEPVTVRRSQKENFADSAGGVVPYRITATGPTIVSTATLREVASWYTDLDVDDIRRRLRTNIEISGVEPFWEDRLFSDAEASVGSPGNAVEFTIGDVTHYGIMSKPRCVVPSRDPDTGELKEDFSKKFIQNRKETFPEWADASTLDRNFETPDSIGENYFYLTVVTRIPGRESGKSISVGDEVSIGEEIPLLQTH